MSHTTADYEDVDPVGGGLHFLRDELDCESLGFSVLEADPGWVGKEHDHAEDGQEEVYFLVEGEATLTVDGVEGTSTSSRTSSGDGEEIRMEAGDAVRISPDATRRLENGPLESTFVLAGAP
ncbi:cupin domain-containing protein [Halopelagius fulvigenes]|uniref:Cupin n=1 Tax=Halopelagius fulvigenes TaxID=1198324 RepID=A0ABD5U3V6_9EURY